MARFNVPPSAPTVHNRAGGEAFALSAAYELYTLAATATLSPKYYEGADKSLVRFIDLVGKCEPAYVAKLAVYCRRELNLRSAPIVLAALLSKIHGGATARWAVQHVIQRPDEIMEMLAFYGATNPHAGKKTVGAHVIPKTIARRPNSMLRGIRDVFESGRFGEYAYAKYDRRGGMYSLRDALFLSHPRARKEGQEALFKKIADRSLATPDTWETALSAAGKTEGVTKITVWERLVNEGKLGHMALLRNLRNILELVPSNELVAQVCKQLVAGAPGGKQFPFRYWSAYLSLITLPGFRGGAAVRPTVKADAWQLKAVLDALERCLKGSAATLTQLQGRVCIACDVSGSMGSPISPKSAIQMFDVGLVLGSILYAAAPERTLLGMFGDNWKILNPCGNPLADVLQIRQREGEVGYGTHGYRVIQGLRTSHLIVDNVVLFTDAQLYGESLAAEWVHYKALAPNARLYVIDLAGHGAAPIRINERDVFLIAGWNDRVFEMVERLTKGESVVDIIMAYDPTGAEDEEENV